MKHLMVYVSVFANIWMAGNLVYPTKANPIPELPRISNTSWTDEDWMNLQVWRQETRYWAENNCNAPLGDEIFKRRF